MQEHPQKDLTMVQWSCLQDALQDRGTAGVSPSVIPEPVLPPGTEIVEEVIDDEKKDEEKKDEEKKDEEKKGDGDEDKEPKPETIGQSA